MNQFLRGVARAAIESFELPDPVLEIGSYQVQGREALVNLRQLFPGREYVGVDMRPGPGVDCVAEVEQLPQADCSVGTLLAFSTFEHVRHFWRGFDEIRRVLRPDGAVLVSVPFYFHIHNYPSDYWRFTPEALNVLLEDYPTRILGWHGSRNRPANVWALAFGAKHAPITARQVETYHRKLAQYAKEPRRWGKRCRYLLGRLMCGRGPFAPYLELNRWETKSYGLAG